MTIATNKTLLSAVLLTSVCFSGQALALDGKALYNNPAKGGCIACHGKDAKTPMAALNAPKLAGQGEKYLLQQMKDIKSGARNNGNTAAMKGVMGMINEAEMAAVAKYLSGLK
ncbi:Cytochrome c4 [hydrothermal vent metagenome]|uniref:Cytochrome c4 n=1 Tax=hydrothermal vent metagenome TaxID=652676 RepID=A0A3B1BAZ2_9ZZZZ